MYDSKTLEDIRDLEIFLAEGTQSLLPRTELDYDEKTRLSDVLNTRYQISVDNNLIISYLYRDLEKDPIIDRVKKEVTFQTKEGIDLILNYEIDDVPLAA